MKQRKKTRSELPGELGIFYSNADYQETEDITGIESTF